LKIGYVGSLKWAGKKVSVYRHLGKITGHFSPTVPPSAAGCFRVVTRVETSVGEKLERLTQIAQ